ncbi:MAG TPA: outer membrane beta-barrel protein [Reyranella sp.]|nr:outer membrane beta-barrel protein [Reyranella sp.]
MKKEWGWLAALAVAMTGWSWSAGAQEARPLWTGFYVGGEAGAGFASYVYGNMTPNYFNTAGIQVRGTGVTQSASNVVGGALAGYAWQVGPFTVGPEIGVRSGGFLAQQPDPFFPTTDQVKSDIRWMASAAVKLGWGRDRWQVFAKGGWAGALADFGLYDNSTTVTAESTTWVNGWTAGVGADYMILDRLSLGVTWDYADLTAGSVGLNCPSCGVGVGFNSPVVDTHLRLNAVMARLSWHFAP